MVVPFFALLYNRPLPKWAFFTAISLAATTLAVWYLAGLEDLTGIEGLVPAMAVNALFSVTVLVRRREPVTSWHNRSEVALT